MRHRLLLGALAGVALSFAALPAAGAATATADGATNIDHVEVADDGTVSVLVGVDGIPADDVPDLASVAVTVEGTSVRATAEPVEAGQIQRTTVLVLDASLSMSGERFEAAKSAAKAFLAAAPEDVRIGLLTFSGQVHDVTRPTTDHQALADAIDRIKLTRGTRVYDAVIAGTALAGTDGARSLLILSDGKDQGHGATLDEATDAAADAGVVVDVVSIDEAAKNHRLLARISDASGGRVIEARDAAALESVFTAQADALASQLLVRFPRPKRADEEASIAVSVDAGGTRYTDTALVPLPAASSTSPEVAAPEAVVTEAPVLGKRALWAGAAALGLGLAGLVFIVLPRGSRQPSLAQRQIAHYSHGPKGSDHARTHDAKLARSSQVSLRDSAVAATHKLLQGDFETRLAQRLTAGGLALTPAEWLLLHAGIAVGSAFLGMVLGGPALMVVLLLTGAVAPWLYLRLKRSRRLATFNGQLAETLQLIAGGLSAGLSLPQAIDTVVREGQEPMAGEMRRVLIEQRLGVDIEDALEGIAERMSSKDFSWVVMAIRIQREVGGNLAELLNTVADTLREREYLRRQVKALSAEGRMSAWVLGGLPIAMTVFMLLFRPDAIRPLYTEPLGLLMIVAAIVLLGLGFTVMSKLVKVEV